MVNGHPESVLLVMFRPFFSAFLHRALTLQLPFAPGPPRDLGRTTSRVAAKGTVRSFRLPRQRRPETKRMGSAGATETSVASVRHRYGFGQPPGVLQRGQPGSAWLVHEWSHWSVPLRGLG